MSDSLLRTVSAGIARPHFEHCIADIQFSSTPPDQDESGEAGGEEDDDDLDDVLDKTCDVTRSSGGKTGTDTRAEPQHKPYRND